MSGTPRSSSPVPRHCAVCCGEAKGSSITADEIFDREAEADEITRQVLTAVRRTFITPFDRTDIQDLITSMDDAIDQMNKTAKTITLFEVRSFDPQMQQMGEIIVRAAEVTAQAVGLLGSLARESKSSQCVNRGDNPHRRTGG